MARALATRPELDPRASAGRALGIALVIALHVAVVYALVAGLAQRVIDVVRAPIVTTIIPPTQPERTLPPPPQPRFTPPPLFVPPPEVRIEKPPPPRTAPTAVTTAPPPPAAPPAVEAPPAPREPARINPRIDLANSREPDYPAISRRLGEQGALLVEALVDPSGRAREVKLLESSGHPRLDQAALAGIKESYRFAPGSIDGKPEPMWVTFKFIWKLK
jgi:periplasmic protein TonB